MTGFGVIGAGTWGSLHARVYADLPGARLAAVCDADGDRAATAAAPTCARVYTDLREMLADPEIHAVSVALPDPLHREAVVAAAEAGKHVLVEKPLATTEADALTMIEAARRANVTLDRKSVV